MTLIIKIWDVLQGLAVYINTPNNKHIVIDAGINEKGFKPIYHINKNHSVNKIDWAIVTHPHKDHIDEIDNLSALSPRVLSRPKHITREVFDWKKIKEGDIKLFKKYFELSERYSQLIDPSNDPTSSINLGGVDIKTFVPKNCPLEDLNNQSLITIISYAGSKILIPGDNEPLSWKELIEQKDFVDAIRGTNILVAPHHGRQSGYCKELFKFITPQLIIISDGPEKPTNAVNDYSNNVSGDGYLVYKSDESTERRKVLSTRKDGMIEIKAYSKEGVNYLIVYKS